MARNRINRGAIKQLDETPAVRRKLVTAARSAARSTRTLAPDGGPHRGYRESIRVADDQDGVRVETTDPFGHLVEFGSVKNPPYAPLQRGARAAGLRLEEAPKT